MGRGRPRAQNIRRMCQLQFLPFSRPCIDQREIDAVSEVLRSGWITTGPWNQKLEEGFCEAFGCKHAIAVASATGGMHVLLKALNIGPGDEVITPSQTWVSTINLISLMGATPVMVDVDIDTLMVDAASVERAVTPRTKAIIPVHYSGAALDLDPLRQVARRHNLPLIEDAAHAVGTRYKNEWVGARGTSVFSFHAIKNLTCAEGGLIATDDDELAARARRLKFHGLAADAFDRAMQGRKPQAEVVEPGYKYNLSDIHAAIATVQLAKLPEMNAKRKALAEYYLTRLAGAKVKPLGLPGYPQEHAWHMFMVRVDPALCGMERNAFMEALKERGIGTGIHFLAAHTHKYYREVYPNLSLPNTEWNSRCLCTLPLFPDMEKDDVDRVVEAVQAVLEGK